MGISFIFVISVLLCLQSFMGASGMYTPSRKLQSILQSIPADILNLLAPDMASTAAAATADNKDRAPINVPTNSQSVPTSTTVQATQTPTGSSKVSSSSTAKPDSSAKADDGFLSDYFATDEGSFSDGSDSSSSTYHDGSYANGEIISTMTSADEDCDCEEGKTSQDVISTRSSNVVGGSNESSNAQQATSSTVTSASNSVVTTGTSLPVTTPPISTNGNLRGSSCGSGCIEAQKAIQAVRDFLDKLVAQYPCGN